MKPTRSLLALSLLPLLLAGCATSNRISVVHPGPAAPSAETSALQSYPGFSEVKKDFQIKGTICAGILPLMKNEAAARETALRNAAAGLGVNALVGFKHLTEQYGGYGVSSAILTSTAVSPAAGATARPRCIVCVLPVTVKTDKTVEAGHLQARLLAELDYQLAEKGYYTYAPARTDFAGLALDAIKPEALKQPLGVEPDFVLKCEIEEGKYLGLQALMMRVALYDLNEHRNIWEWREGEKSEPPVVQWGLLEQLTSPTKKWFSSDKWASNNPGQPKEQVSAAIKKAAKTLPPVSGHHQLKM